MVGTDPVCPNADSKIIERNHKTSKPSSLVDKSISSMLAAVLAISMTPALSWAEEIESLPEEPAIEEVLDAHDDAALGEEASGAEQTGPSDALKSERLLDSALVGMDQEADSAMAPPESTGQAGQPQAVRAASDEITLTSAHCLNIATSPNHSSATGGAAGYQEVGTTLYALIFKASSASSIARTKVKDDGSLTYTWYATSAKSNRNLSDSDIIPDETGSTLTLTDDLAGKYIAVKATDRSGNTASGPRSAGKPNGTHYGAGPVMAAVPEKFALDAKSYILIQPSADSTSKLETIGAASIHEGDELWANAWDSEPTAHRRIQAQDGWEYQWLAAESRDAVDTDFKPIAGQTSQSLKIDEALAKELSGKYIRVRVAGDGQSLYGPSSAFDTPSGAVRNTPGPVVAAGQIMINHVVLACNGEEFGDDYETAIDMHGGDVVDAAAYGLDGSAPSDLYRGDEVDFSWQIARSEDGVYAEVATGQTAVIEEAWEGSFLKVVATAKNGVPGSDRCETAPSLVLKKGASRLYSVEILNAGKCAQDTGTTLVAQAYTGDYWSQAPVAEGVEYVWSWTDKDPASWDFDASSDLHMIEGATGDTFEVPAFFEGRWVCVSANAGVNTVPDLSGYYAIPVAAGPFKAPGSIEIYTAPIIEKRAGDNEDRFVYKTGEVIGIEAYGTSAAGTKGERIPDSKLEVMWEISDSRWGEFAKLDDGNANEVQFSIPESYEGKYLKCTVSAGFNSESNSMTYAIGKGETSYEAPVPAEPTVPQHAGTSSVRIVGTTIHKVGQDYTFVDWVPPTDYSWDEGIKVKAWDAFAKLLDEAGYFYNLDGGCPYSITTPDRSYSLAMSNSMPWSYWAFYVNGAYAGMLPSGYVIQDGDAIELRYIDAYGRDIDPDVPGIEMDPDAELPDWNADWADYSASPEGSFVTVAPTPKEDAEAAWTFDFSKYADKDGKAASEPLIVNGYIYIAANKTLVQIDSKTGRELATAKLAAPVNYTSRPVYADGRIVVALNGGRIQALAADSLKTLWVTDGISAATQSSCTLSVRDGCLYVGTAEVHSSPTGAVSYDNGAFACYDTKSGERVWAVRNAEEGYFWTGAAFIGGYAVISTEAGTVQSIDTAPASDGTQTAAFGSAHKTRVVSEIRLGAHVNSDCIPSSDGRGVLVATDDGKIHSLAVGDAGELLHKGELASGLARVQSTPARLGDTFFIGGSDADGRAALSIVDLPSGRTHKVTMADGSRLPESYDGIKATPLVSAQPDGVYVYFTVNSVTGQWPDYTSGGGVYRYRIGDAEAHLMFDAKGCNEYCDSPVVADAQGRLYYINDSGHLFALKATPYRQDNAREEGEGASSAIGNGKPTAVAGSNVYTRDLRRLASGMIVPDAGLQALQEQAAGADPIPMADISNNGNPLSSPRQSDHGDSRATYNDISHNWAIAGMVIGLSLFAILVLRFAHARRRNRES